jgi:hypothetical protein
MPKSQEKEILKEKNDTLKAKLEEINELFVIMFGIKMDDYIYKGHKAIRFDSSSNIEVIFYEDDGVLKTNQKLDFQLRFEEPVVTEMFLEDMFVYFQHSMNKTIKNLSSIVLTQGTSYIKDYLSTIEEFTKRMSKEVES